MTTVSDTCTTLSSARSTLRWSTSAVVGRKNIWNIGELLYKGPVRKLRTAPKHKCPRTTSPQNWNKTQHKTASCVTLNCAPHQHTSRIGTSNTQALQWQQSSIRSYLWRPENAHIQGPNVFISSKKFLHKIKLLLLFLCLQYQDRLCCHCMACPQDADGEMRAGARDGGLLRIHWTCTLQSRKRTILQLRRGARG